MARIRIDLPESFLFETEIPVRISDINYGGHLGNDSVLAIVHEARIRYLASLGYTEKDIEGKSVIMNDVAVVYRSESFYGDILLVSVDVRDFTGTGFDICYKIARKKDGKEIARIKTGMIFFDYDTGKIVRIPEAFRLRFK